MEEFFDSFPISRDRVERGRMAISTRNAGHTEELSKYKNTLEKQWRRESSFLLFKQKQFLSRQQKVLGKSFQVCKLTQQDVKKTGFPRLEVCRKETAQHIAERKMSDSRLSDVIQVEGKIERRRILSAGSKLSPDVSLRIKDNQQEVKALSAIGSFGHKEQKEQDSDDKIAQFESSKNDLFQEKQVKQDYLETASKCNDKEAECRNVAIFCAESSGNANESRLTPERLRAPPKSISLPEMIICPKIFDETANLYQSLGESSNKGQTKKSKKNNKKKHKTNKRESRSIVKSSSLPDVRPKASEKPAKSKPSKSADKSKHDSNITLPRVTPKSHEVKPKKTEGSVNLSVVCRVIRIKNNLTRRKRSKKGQEKTAVKNHEEITTELWETLKDCRYLRTRNTSMTTENAVL